MVTSRHDGGLALQRRRNKARLVTDSSRTDKWRKKHMVYRFMDKFHFIAPKQIVWRLHKISEMHSLISEFLLKNDKRQL